MFYTIKIVDIFKYVETHFPTEEIVDLFPIDYDP